MIRLIVTADDKLYGRLAHRARIEGYDTQRSKNVLDGFERAASLSIDTIVVDMSLRTAGTLLEALHNRKETASIPVLAVIANEARSLPLELRRLCAAVLEVDNP